MNSEKISVFIDGSAGTTGLRIRERLSGRSDLEIITLPAELRKDKTARAEALNSAEIAFLCLPDEAAKEAVAMITSPDTVLIDTSTAHRVGAGFAYGFPELSQEFEKAIKKSHRIAVPGCHASGFIALVYPLTESGLLDKSALLSCFSITGYSGGGKKMIASYEVEERDNLLVAPRLYGISQTHKHLREMSVLTELETPPLFSPIVADYYSGMEVAVPLHVSQVNGSAEDIKAVYKAKYGDGLVKYSENPDEDGFLSAAKFSGKDTMEITVAGNADRILLAARYDNLGKGASGAAIECMNIVIGKEKSFGLEL